MAEHPKNLASRLMGFYRELIPPEYLPDGIDVLHPQKDPAVLKMVEQFLHKYYSDTKYRRLMLGINPGRLGAGLTGINFTAPRQLSINCGIPQHLGNSSELSAEFIYEVIEKYGGPSAFYGNWFIGAVCPLGFLKNGNNLNYYDDKQLMTSLTPFIVQSIRQQLNFGFLTDYCICIGEGKNFKFLSSLNDQQQWFKKIIPVAHPRFIMQYKRIKKEYYVNQYLQKLGG